MVLSERRAEELAPDDAAAGPRVVFPLHVDLPFALFGLLFGVRPDRAEVVVSEDRFVARFGPWRVETPLSNVAAATVTGPYPWARVVGPARLSLADGGLTFATTTRRGVCVRFHEPVPGLVPSPAVRHPTLTVTVAEPTALAELLERRRLRHADRKVDAERLIREAHDDLESLTAAELRERARGLGIRGVSKLKKAELIDLLRPKVS